MLCPAGVDLAAVAHTGGNRVRTGAVALIGPFENIDGGNDKRELGAKVNQVIVRAASTTIPTSSCLPLRSSDSDRASRRSIDGHLGKS